MSQLPSRTLLLTAVAVFAVLIFIAFTTGRVNPWFAVSGALLLIAGLFQNERER